MISPADEAVLEQFVGSTTFGRPQAYARRGAVRQREWAESGLRVVGEVQGGASRPYRASVELTRSSSAQLSALRSACPARSGALFRLEYDDYEALEWAGLFLDEAQFVKNRYGKTCQQVKKLPVPFKVAMTGTPMENNLMELCSLLFITAPGLLPNPDRFEKHYRVPSSATPMATGWPSSAGGSAR